MNELIKNLSDFSAQLASHAKRSGLDAGPAWCESRKALIDEAVAALSAQPSPDAAQCVTCKERKATSSDGRCYPCVKAANFEPLPDAAQGSEHGGEIVNPYTLPIAREGEPIFACVLRNRSGISSGEIDMGARFIHDLPDGDQQAAIEAAYSIYLKWCDETLKKSARHP